METPRTSHSNTCSNIFLSSSLLSHLKHAIAMRTQDLRNQKTYFQNGNPLGLKAKELHTLECLLDFLRGAEECRIFTQTHSQNATSNKLQPKTAGGVLLPKYRDIPDQDLHANIVSEENLNYNEE